MAKTYAQLAEQAKPLLRAVFGPDRVLVEVNETDEYFDGMITFDGVVGLSGDAETNLFQVTTIAYVPGVMYHNDGSGTPPDVDVTEVGVPTTFVMAMVEVVKLLAANSLCSYLDAEADKDAAEAYKAFSEDRTPL